MMEVGLSVKGAGGKVKVLSMSELARNFFSTYLHRVSPVDFFFPAWGGVEE
jgi:hypothetical protein